MKKTSSFRFKIISMLAVAVAGMLLLAAVSFWQLRAQLVDGRRAELVAAVQSAYTIVDGYRRQAESGSISVADAQAAAVAALRESRYGPDGTDYFYIWTLDSVNVLVPSKPEWAGRRMVGEVRDADGVDVIATMTEKLLASADGRMFVEVNFPKPGSSVPQPKLQYAQRLPGWDWMIGSGLYLDGIAAQVQAALLRTLALAGALVLALGAVGLWIARSVLREIGGEPRQAMAAMRAVAAGDLTVALAARDDESLMSAFDETVRSLRATIVRVRGSIDSIGTASSEIAAGSADLSGRTELTASNLQQTASAMEQIAGTVQTTAHSSRLAHELADAAGASAARGSAVVAQVVTTMGAINDSSRRVTEIINVIDGIAFQTNILALNAAVEAARAGEQGRGFAVVAAEVRTLAQRSAQAARQIKALIEESVGRVDAGSALVTRAGEAMAALESSVARVTTTISEITDATGEQSRGIAEVNRAVAELDRATQQNAALVEQSGAAAESLNEQTRRLREAVEVFRV